MPGTQGLQIRLAVCLITKLNDYFIVNQPTNFTEMAQPNPPEPSMYPSFQQPPPQMQQPPQYQAPPPGFAPAPATIVVGAPALGQDPVQVM